MGLYISVKFFAFIRPCKSLYLSLAKFIYFMVQTKNNFLHREKYFITTYSKRGDNAAMNGSTRKSTTEIKFAKS